MLILKDSIERCAPFQKVDISWDENLLEIALSLALGLLNEEIDLQEDVQDIMGHEPRGDIEDPLKKLIEGRLFLKRF